jgi:DNA-binding beta-propeller fold protein YncE
MDTGQVSRRGRLSIRSVPSSPVVVLLLLVSLAMLSALGPSFSSDVRADTPASTRVAVGANPSEVAVDPTTDTVYVGNYNTVSVVDGATDAVTDTISPLPLTSIFSAYGQGAGLAVDPVTDRIYAASTNYTTSSVTGTVSVIDGATDAVIGSISLPATTSGLAVDPTTDTIYALLAPSGFTLPGPGTALDVIDGATDAVAATVSLNVTLQGASIAVDPATNMIYVAGTQDPPQVYVGMVAVVDGASNTLVTLISTGSNPNQSSGVAVDPVTDTIYSTDSPGGSVTVISGTSDTVTASFPITGGAHFIAVNPATGKLYVTGSSNILNSQFATIGNLYILDATTGSVIQTLAVGQSPSAVAADPETNSTYVADMASDSLFVFNGFPATTSTYQLVVTTQDQSGHVITGLPIELSLPNGSAAAALASGSSPATFTLESGAPYTLQANDLGACAFSSWSDTGSTSNLRSLSISQVTQMTAIYDCGPGQAPLGAWNATTGYPLSAGDETCVSSSGYIYCVGGVGVIDNVEYAPLTSSGIGQWASTTSYPTGIVAQSCVSSDDYIYCVGGQLRAGAAAAAYYAPLSSSGVGAWASTTNYPVPVDYQSCATNGGYIYCVGGLAEGYLAPTGAVYYAPISSSGIGAWSAGGSYPIATEDETCVIAAGNIYCINGYDSPENAVYYAPISSSTGSLGDWLGTTMFPAGYFAVLSEPCVAPDGYIYCIGNHNSSYDAPASASGVGVWTATTPVSAVSCVTSGTYIYCLGGPEAYYTSILQAPSTAQLTVDTVDTTGQALSGYYTVLYQGSDGGGGGGAVASGFSPASFALDIGQQYTVQVDDYGSCQFDHWADTGSTSALRTISVTSDTQLTAVYNCGTSTSTIDVSTVNSTGSAISGYYTTLWQNGVQLHSCFSACSFTVNNGQTYQVAAASYGSETFSHWQNDGATGAETVDVPGTSTTVTLTAVYSP